jgi:hypothetical protein
MGIPFGYQLTKGFALVRKNGLESGPGLVGLQVCFNRTAVVPSNLECREQASLSSI